jgi:hypothetical protein
MNLCTEPIFESLSLLWVTRHKSSYPLHKCWSTSCFVVVPQCSREVSASRVSHPKYRASKLVSFHVHLIHQLHLYVSFVSLLGDTSRPSLDKSIPVDFNTLFRNQTWKPVSTLGPACLNVRPPHIRQ